jgi:hypothetical protein
MKSFALCLMLLFVAISARAQDLPVKSERPLSPYYQCLDAQQKLHPTWQWGDFAAWCNETQPRVMPMIAPQVIAAPAIYPTAYPYFTTTASYGMYGYVIGGCGTMYLPRLDQPLNCIRTALMFKVREDYLNDAAIRIDGHDFGRVGQFTSRKLRPDQKLYLGADSEHIVEIVRYTESGVNQTIVKRIKPETVRLSGGKAIEIMVSEAEFAHTPYGREVTPEREHVGGKELVLGVKPE